MKKLSLLLLAVLLCTVRVEAWFEEGERDSDHSERSENRDTTGRNSDQARTDAGRQQGSGGASTTVRDDALAPSAPPLEEDFSNDSGNTAASASAAGAKDAAVEDIFDDAIATRIKEEAQQALAAITRDRDAFRARLAQRHIIPPEELIAVAEALHQSHDVWAQRSDQYSGVLMNAFATRDVPEAEGKNIGALIASCYQVSQAAGNWINEVEAVLLDSTRIEDGRRISKATKRPSGSSDGDHTSPGGSGSDRSRRDSSGSDSSGSGFSVMKESPEPKPKEGAIVYVAGPVPFPIDEDFFSPREAFYSSSLKERQDYMNGFDPVDLRTGHRKSSSLPPDAIVRGPVDLPARDSGDRTDSEEAHHVPGRAMRRTLDGVKMVSEKSTVKARGAITMAERVANLKARGDNTGLTGIEALIDTCYKQHPEMFDSKAPIMRGRPEGEAAWKAHEKARNERRNKLTKELREKGHRTRLQQRAWDREDMEERLEKTERLQLLIEKTRNEERRKLCEDIMKDLSEDYFLWTPFKQKRLDILEKEDELEPARERLARAEEVLRPYNERSLQLNRKLYKTYDSLYSFVSEYGSDYFSGRRAKLEKEYSDLANDQVVLKAKREKRKAEAECKRLEKELRRINDMWSMRCNAELASLTQREAASSGSSRGESVIDYNARRREEEARAARNFVSHGYAYAYTVQGGSLGWSWVYR